MTLLYSPRQIELSRILPNCLTDELNLISCWLRGKTCNIETLSVEFFIITEQRNMALFLSKNSFLVITQKKSILKKFKLWANIHSHRISFMFLKYQKHLKCPKLGKILMNVANNKYIFEEVHIMWDSNRKMLVKVLIENSEYKIVYAKLF